MKRIFEQRSELQVAKCLVVHVLFSSYNVSSYELWNEKKAMQQWNLRVADNILLNQVRVNHVGVHADKVVIKFWFLRSSASQYYSKFIANNATKNVSQVRTKECNNRLFICKINLNILRFSRHFNCDAAFTVFVAFLNESVHGFNNNRNGRVETVFQKEKFGRIWKFFIKKHVLSICDILVLW